MKRKRQTITCAECGQGNQTHQGRGLCAACLNRNRRAGTLDLWPHIVRGGRQPRTYGDVELMGGQWRTGRHGIQHWVPNAEAATPEPTPPAAELIACPTCGATVSQACTSTNGYNITNHADRITPRQITCRHCGTATQGQQIYCPPCRTEARKASRRIYANRVRSEARADKERSVA